MPEKPPRDLLMNTVLGTMAILGSFFFVIVSYAVYEALGMPRSPASVLATLTGLVAAAICIIAIAKRRNLSRGQVHPRQPAPQEPPTHRFAPSQSTEPDQPPYTAPQHHPAEPRSPSYREVLANRNQDETTRLTPPAPTSPPGRKPQ